MDDENLPGRCGWIALGFFMLLCQELLPLSVILRMAGINAAELIDCGGISELFRRALVLGGMVAGLLTATLMTMLLLALVRGVAKAFSSASARRLYEPRSAA